MPEKVVYIISGVDYSLGFEWLEKHLDRERYSPSFVFLNGMEPSLHRHLLDKNIDSTYLKLTSKKDYPMVFIKLLDHIIRRRPSIVHAHLFEACLLGLPAARLAGVPKRIYTRHHSTYHFDYHPGMVKFDRWINSHCTHIAAISENVRYVLVEMEKVEASKVFLIHHGFELEEFLNPDAASVSLLREKYNPKDRKPVIGVISRFVDWKGVQYIIPAFKQLLADYPSALLVLANARGDMEKELMQMLNELPEGSYITIGFEKELFALYRLFNTFVHVPVDTRSEAFGQTYVEALAAGVPAVFTLSGIANEFIIDRKNAIVVPYRDSKSIYSALKTLLSNSEIRNSLIEEGRNSVTGRFTVERMMNSLYKMYAA